VGVHAHILQRHSVCVCMHTFAAVWGCTYVAPEPSARGTATHVERPQRIPRPALRARGACGALPIGIGGGGARLLENDVGGLVQRAGAEEERPLDGAVGVADGDAEAVVERRAGVRAQRLGVENGGQIGRCGLGLKSIECRSSFGDNSEKE
jgi:hypothetical protein